MLQESRAYLNENEKKFPDQQRDAVCLRFLEKVLDFIKKRADENPDEHEWTFTFAGSGDGTSKDVLECKCTGEKKKNPTANATRGGKTMRGRGRGR